MNIVRLFSEAPSTDSTISFESDDDNYDYDMAADATSTSGEGRKPSGFITSVDVSQWAIDVSLEQLKFNRFEYEFGVYYNDFTLDLQHLYERKGGDLYRFQKNVVVDYTNCYVHGNDEVDMNGNGKSGLELYCSANRKNESHIHDFLGQGLRFLRTCSKEEVDRDRSDWKVRVNIDLNDSSMTLIPSVHDTDDFDLIPDEIEFDNKKGDGSQRQGVAGTPFDPFRLVFKSVDVFEDEISPPESASSSSSKVSRLTRVDDVQHTVTSSILEYMKTAAAYNSRRDDSREYSWAQMGLPPTLCIESLHPHAETIRQCEVSYEIHDIHTNDVYFEINGVKIDHPQRIRHYDLVLVAKDRDESQFEYFSDSRCPPTAEMMDISKVDTTRILLPRYTRCCKTPGTLEHKCRFCTRWVEDSGYPWHMKYGHGIYCSEDDDQVRVVRVECQLIQQKRGDELARAFTKCLWCFQCIGMAHDSTFYQGQGQGYRTVLSRYIEHAIEECPRRVHERRKERSI